jgi:(S)-mandelate dehydrogenase
MLGLDKGPATTTAAASTVGKNMDAGFDFEALLRIRERWPRKLVVKGVMRADDAQRLVAMGCDGIVVSNHGGRQFDGAAATLEALPAVVAAVRGQAPVLLDGGVRRGQHLAQALASGAQGVLVGRAALYGVAAGGEAGARRALAILQDEFARSMRLCGARSVNEITPDLLFGPGGV